MELTEEEAAQIDAILKRLLIVGEGKTEDIYDFQKTGTKLTIFVAICAVIVACIPLFKKGAPPIDTKQLEQEIHSLKIPLDSISIHQKVSSFLDTPPKKRP